MSINLSLFLGYKRIVYQVGSPKGTDFVVWSCGTLFLALSQGATTPHNKVCAFSSLDLFVETV